MDYKKLSELDNTYPSPINYKKGNAALSLSEQVVLTGVYPEKNKIDFKIPSISDLKWVPGTEFRFIIAIFTTYNDTKPTFYTSEVYYKDLEASIKENNPYLVQLSFLPTNVVSYVVDENLKLFETFRPSELKSFINVRQNIAFRSGSIVDYDNLVTYIDWLVSPVSPLDEPNYGVLKPETIAGWDQLVGNFADGKLGEGVSGSFGIGAEFVELSNTKLKLAQTDLANQKAELEKLIKDIAAIEEAIRTKKGFAYEKRAASVTINGLVFSANNIGGGFSVPSETTKANSLIKILKDVVNAMYERKKGLENLIAQSISSINNAKAEAKPAVDLNSVKKSLPPKIPKIPKLPDVPKIPKLPSLDSLGGMVIAALPALPALPKLSLPKLPSFKFPKLPKFKKKEPNEPKKFKIKKKKGLSETPKVPEVPKAPTTTQMNSVSINGVVYTEGSPGYAQAKAEVTAALEAAKNRTPGDLLKELDKMPF